MKLQYAQVNNLLECHDIGPKLTKGLKEKNPSSKKFGTTTHILRGVSDSAASLLYLKNEIIF